MRVVAVNGLGDEGDLGFVPALVILPIAAGTFSLLLIEASLDVYFGGDHVVIPPESVAAQQIYSLRQQLVQRWKFSAIKYPRDELVAALDQLAATARGVYERGAAVRAYFSGPWKDATAIVDRKMLGWVSTWDGLRAAARITPTIEVVGGKDFIDARAVPSLLDKVKDFTQAARDFVWGIEYSAANDSFQLPAWAVSFLNLLKQLAQAIVSLFKSSGDILVALLQALAAAAQTTANIVKALVDVVPVIIYTAVGGAALFFGYKGYRALRGRTT